MKRILFVASIFFVAVSMAGCGSAASGPGPLTEEQQRKGEAEMKTIEDEERGAPIKRKK